MLSTKLWQAEINRQFTRHLALLNTLPKQSPLPWYRRQWGRCLYRLAQIRERLGEFVAGRKFDE